MPIEKLRPARRIIVEPWDGTVDGLARLAAFTGQQLEADHGTVRVVVSGGDEVAMRPGWVVYRSEDGRIGVLSPGAASDLVDPAA
jgi:hypothetical protein